MALLMHTNMGTQGKKKKKADAGYSVIFHIYNDNGVLNKWKFDLKWTIKKAFVFVCECIPGP